MTIQPRRKMNRLRSRMCTEWRLPNGSTRVTAEPVMIVAGVRVAISDHQALSEGTESDQGPDHQQAQHDRQVDAQRYQVDVMADGQGARQRHAVEQRGEP